MEDEKAYHIFLLLHVPLYVILLWLLFSPASQVAYYVVDIFLLAHMLVHLGFRKHPANRLDGTLSKVIINLAGLFAAIHITAISIR